MSRDDLCKKISTSEGHALYTEKIVKVENLGVTSQNGQQPRDRDVAAAPDGDRDDVGRLRGATRCQHADDLIDDRVDDSVVDARCDVGNELCC